MRRSSRPFRVFVCGTDTGVGKTETAAALLELLRDQGRRPAPFKPYETGCVPLSRPADALELIRASGAADPLDLVCPHRFRPPLAPWVAAELRGRMPSFAVT